MWKTWTWLLSFTFPHQFLAGFATLQAHGEVSERLHGISPGDRPAPNPAGARAPASTAHPARSRRATGTAPPHPGRGALRLRRAPRTTGWAPVTPLLPTGGINPHAEAPAGGTTPVLGPGSGCHRQGGHCVQAARPLPDPRPAAAHGPAAAGGSSVRTVRGAAPLPLSPCGYRTAWPGPPQQQRQGGRRDSSPVGLPAATGPRWGAAPRGGGARLPRRGLRAGRAETGPRAGRAAAPLRPPRPSRAGRAWRCCGGCERGVPAPSAPCGSSPAPAARCGRQRCCCCSPPAPVSSGRGRAGGAGTGSRAGRWLPRQPRWVDPGLAVSLAAGSGAAPQGVPTLGFAAARKFGGSPVLASHRPQAELGCTVRIGARGPALGSGALTEVGGSGSVRGTVLKQNRVTRKTRNSGKTRRKGVRGVGVCTPQRGAGLAPPWVPSWSGVGDIPRPCRCPRRRASAFPRGAAGPGGHREPGKPRRPRQGWSGKKRFRLPAVMLRAQAGLLVARGRRGTRCWDPLLGPAVGTRCWDPLLGPAVGTRCWDPLLGPAVRVSRFCQVLAAIPLFDGRVERIRSLPFACASAPVVEDQIRWCTLR